MKISGNFIKIQVVNGDGDLLPPMVKYSEILPRGYKNRIDCIENAKRNGYTGWIHTCFNIKEAHK